MNKIDKFFVVIMSVILIYTGYYIDKNVSETDMGDVEFVGTPVIGFELHTIIFLTLLAFSFIAILTIPEWGTYFIFLGRNGKI